MGPSSPPLHPQEARRPVHAGTGNSSFLKIMHLTIGGICCGQTTREKKRDHQGHVSLFIYFFSF